MGQVTTVINVRGRKDLDFSGHDGVIYVGRAVPRAGYQRSRWANPWKASEFASAHACVEHYAQMVKHVLGYEVGNNYDMKIKTLYEVEMFYEGIKTACQLRGRVLGCWCCDWNGTGEPAAPCHAVVLARLADGLGVN